MNIAYKHLDSKLRIADLTIGQWGSILAGAGLGVIWALYLSPFGTYVTLVIAIYLGALPAAAALVATMSELDIWLLARAALRWRNLEGRFRSGPGQAARGYVVKDDRTESQGSDSTSPTRELDLAELWRES